MDHVGLTQALSEAAQSAFKQHRTLSTTAAVESLSREFIGRWLFATDNVAAQDPRNASGSYFFLLQKNLSVTNISLVELLALIRKRARDRETGLPLQVDFMSTNDYRAFFINLWESIFTTLKFTEGSAGTASESEPLSFPSKLINQAISTLLNFHADFFHRNIVVDIYFTSALVHIPLSIRVDVREVTFESGYIHSSGIALYVRNIEKADKNSLLLRLTSFFNTHRGKRYLVTPYASEFFGPYEGKSSYSTRNGLDGVRLQLRKHFIEDKPLLNFLAELKEHFPDQVYIPTGAGDYTDERLSSINAGACNDCTIWFITDAGFSVGDSDNFTNRDRNLYIIVYAQYYFNGNQFAVFKERKPAWIASTTLPHTLSAAMVNVAKHHSYMSSDSDEHVIIDPFCGTGTTLFDAAVRFPNARIIGLDRDPFMPTLVKDNLQFFAFDRDDVAAILSIMRSLEDGFRRAATDPAVNTNSTIARILSEDRPKEQPIPNTRVPLDVFEFCFRALVKELRLLPRVVGDNILSDAAVSRLAERGFSAALLGEFTSDHYGYVLRVVFFLLWRALLMNTFSIRTEVRTPKAIYNIFYSELSRSVKEYHAFEQLLHHDVLDRTATFCERSGSYSNEGCVNPDFISDLKRRTHEVNEEQITPHFINSARPGIHLARVADSIEVLKKLEGTADIVLTDPPYGFNTQDGGTEEIKRFYSELVPALIKATKKRGQLMVSLPAFAKNGKQIPFYQTRESVARQIVGCTEAARRRIIQTVETVPSDRALFRLPWYWGSTSTIERRIVHFIIE